MVSKEHLLRNLSEARNLTLQEVVTEANRLMPFFVPGQARYKVSEEVSARTVRYYMAKGLIHRPIGYRGRNAVFTGPHVLQVLAVKSLQSSYIALRKIADILADLSPHDLSSFLLGERSLPLVLPRTLRKGNPPAGRRWRDALWKRYRIHDKLELSIQKGFDIFSEDVDIQEVFSGIMQVLARTGKNHRASQDAGIDDVHCDELDLGYLPPALPLRNASRAVVALVTEGGLVPKGNPDRLESARASRYLRYSIKNLDDFRSGEFESIDRGWDTGHVNDDPDRLLPLDVMRALEREHVFSRLHPYYYTTTGAGTAADVARKIGKDLAAELKRQGVSAVILTAT